MKKLNETFLQYGPELDTDLLAIPGFSVEPADLPNLGNGEDPDVQQKTFILSNDQADTIERAIAKMKKDSYYTEDEINSNTNGTALALICERYV